MDKYYHVAVNAKDQWVWICTFQNELNLKLWWKASELYNEVTIRHEYVIYMMDDKGWLVSVDDWMKKSTSFWAKFDKRIA